MNVCFIGIGIMGVRQAANVLAGGFPLVAYSRSPEKADSLGIDLRGLKTVRARWLELLYKFPEAKSIQDLARLYM